MLLATPGSFVSDLSVFTLVILAIICFVAFMFCMLRAVIVTLWKSRNPVSKHIEADNSDLVEWWMDDNYIRHLGGRVDVSIAFKDLKRYCHDAPKDPFHYVNFLRIVKDLYLVGSETGGGVCFIANLRPKKRGETLHRMLDGSVAQREEISVDSHSPPPQTPVA